MEKEFKYEIEAAKHDLPNLEYIEFLKYHDHATIWRAKDKLTNETFIVKQFTIPTDEALILKKIKHQCHTYYVCIVDYKVTDNYEYIIMEDLVGYVILKDWLKEKWKILNALLDNSDIKGFVEEARPFFTILDKLVDIILHLNDEDNFIHGMLNTSNILVNPLTYDIRLIDFGSTEEKDSRNKLYDIYSLGYVFFEILFNTVYLPRYEIDNYLIIDKEQNSNIGDRLLKLNDLMSIYKEYASPAIDLMVRFLNGKRAFLFKYD